MPLLELLLLSKPEYHSGSVKAGKTAPTGLGHDLDVKRGMIDWIFPIS
jgi:hypothetical protein